MYASSFKLPTAIAVGPPRTATTWMYRLLSASGVGVPRVKETDFFGANFARGLEWYAEFFADCPTDAPRVELCPNYFADLDAPARIAATLPDCTIVVTLRDPVDRAWSHYRLLRSRGLTRADFLELARAPGSLIYESARYAFHLRRWFERFGRARVRVLLYEDLVTEPLDFVAEFCAFIGLEPAPSTAAILGAHRRINTAAREARRPRLAHAALRATRWLDAHRASRLRKLLGRAGLWRVCFAEGAEFAPLSQAAAAAMHAFYEPEIAALEELLGRSLEHWRGGRSDAADASASDELPDLRPRGNARAGTDVADGATISAPMQRADD